MEVDIVVCGSGAAGLTAAVVAANAGLEVLVVESTPWFGGTTAFSGGGAWLPGHRHMAETGSADSREEVETYLRAVLGDKYDPEIIGAFLDNAPAMVAHMEDSSQVRFVANDVPDYEPEHAGWKAGRMLLTADFDARLLGKLRNRLRPPRRDMGLFHSMQVSMFDPAMFKRFYRSAAAFRYTAARFVRYLADRLHYGRGMRVVNGNALVARLLLSASERGVTLWTEARACELIFTAGAVTGVEIERNGKSEAVDVRGGVVLATGGFGANPEMRARFIPHADYGWSLQPEGCRGDGIAMGIAAGGAINEGNVANGIWQTTSGYPRADGSMEISIHAFGDRHCPGSLIVDAATGQRFVNEAGNYQRFGQTMHKAGVRYAWMISEAPAARKYGIGLAKPWPFPIRPWLRKNYVVADRTIAGLAGKIGIDSGVLCATVEQFNRNAALGMDPQFQRGADAYSRYNADPDHKPNPSLGPLRTAPFYAVQIRPGELSTLAGLVTNGKAQVLRHDGRPVPGLYAAGLDNNSIWSGHYPGGGCSIGPAMTFGYIAARHIAGTLAARA